MRSAARHTSAALVVPPTLNLSELAKTSSEHPIARSVRDGSLEPLAHAEPVEHATPARSNAITSAWRSTLGKAMFRVWGSR